MRDPAVRVSSGCIGVAAEGFLGIFIPILLNVFQMVERSAPIHLRVEIMTGTVRSQALSTTLNAHLLTTTRSASFCQAVRMTTRIPHCFHIALANSRAYCFPLRKAVLSLVVSWCSVHHEATHSAWTARGGLSLFHRSASFSASSSSSSVILAITWPTAHW